MKDKWPIKTRVSDEVYIDLESSIWIKIQKLEQSSSRSCLSCGLLEFVLQQNNTSSMPWGVTYNSLLTSIERKRVINIKRSKKEKENWNVAVSEPGTSKRNVVGAKRRWCRRSARLSFRTSTTASTTASTTTSTTSGMTPTTKRREVTKSFVEILSLVSTGKSECGSCKWPVASSIPTARAELSLQWTHSVRPQNNRHSSYNKLILYRVSGE